MFTFSMVHSASCFPFVKIPTESQQLALYTTLNIRSPLTAEKETIFLRILARVASVF